MLHFMDQVLPNRTVIRRQYLLPSTQPHRRSIRRPRHPQHLSTTSPNRRLHRHRHRKNITRIRQKRMLLPPLRRPLPPRHHRYPRPRMLHRPPHLPLPSLRHRNQTVKPQPRWRSHPHLPIPHHHLRPISTVARQRPALHHRPNRRRHHPVVRRHLTLPTQPSRHHTIHPRNRLTPSPLLRPRRRRTRSHQSRKAHQQQSFSLHRQSHGLPATIG